MKTGWIFLLDLLLDGVMVMLALRLGGMGKQDINLSGVPVVLVLRGLKLPYPQSRLFQSLQDPCPVVLEIIED